MIKSILVSLTLLFATASTSAQEITLDRACGAGGTGITAKGERETRDPRPGQRVNAAGEWVACAMPRRPKDCPRLHTQIPSEKGHPVTYFGVGAEYVGKYRTQHIHTHRSAKDHTVIKRSTRRMWCTPNGWSTRRPEA